MRKETSSRQKPFCDKYRGVKESRESVIMILKDKNGKETIRKL